MKCPYCGKEPKELIVSCIPCYAKKRIEIEEIIFKTVCRLCKIKLEILAKPEIEEVEKRRVVDNE